MQVKDSRIKSQTKEKKTYFYFLSFLSSILHVNQKSMVSYLRKTKKGKRWQESRNTILTEVSKHKRYTANVIAAKFAKLDKLRESYVRLLQGLQKCLMATNLYAHVHMSVSNTHICMHLRTYVCVYIHMLYTHSKFSILVSQSSCIAFYYHSHSLF